MGKQSKEPPLIDESGQFRPCTPLGRRLWEIRQRHIANGGRLLSWEEIDAELLRVKPKARRPHPRQASPGR